MRGLTVAVLLGCLLAGAARAEDELPPAMVAVADAIDLGNQRQYKAAIKKLESVLKDDSQNLDARVGRGVYRYHSGDAAGARKDLQAAFSSQVWEHRLVESKTGTDVSVTQTRLDTSELRQTGVAILVLMAAREGDVAGANKLLARGRGVFGDVPALLAVEARVLAADGKMEKAWPTLAKALTRPDPTGFVAAVASEMLALDPEGCPQPVKDWLQAAGQWTAHYNAAIGHLRARDYPACVAEVADGLATFPDHPKMLDVGYPCAARVDLARAESWLEKLGGPRKAEPWSVLAHARTLQTNHRPDEALTLLDGMPHKLPGELPAQVETTQLDLLVKAGRLDDAQKACRGDALVAELGVGHALVNAKKLDDAVAFLEKLCPKMKGQAAYGNCSQLLEYAVAAPR